MLKKQRLPDKVSIIISPANMQEGGLYLGDADSILDEKLMRKLRITAVVSVVSEFGEHPLTQRSKSPT